MEKTVTLHFRYAYDPPGVVWEHSACLFNAAWNNKAVRRAKRLVLREVTGTEKPEVVKVEVN